MKNDKEKHITVTLTPDEVSMIREDIESTRKWFDDEALNPGPLDGPEDVERAIEGVRTATNILRKIGSEK